MLSLAIIFLILSIVAGAFGFTGIAVSAAQIARVLFFLFIVLFLISVVFMFLRG